MFGLKCHPRKGCHPIWKARNFTPLYIRTFKIHKRVGPMAYTLELPEELSNVYSTFHVSNLNKCLSDESLVILMKELRLDDKLSFMEELVEIKDREVKQLRQSPLVSLLLRLKDFKMILRVTTAQLQEALGTNLDMSTAYHPQTDGQKLIRDTTEKIFQIKNRLLAARSRQKSYADKRLKPLEFEVGDMVLLKVSPWKGAVRFGKRGKLSPRYIGPFKVFARIGPVAYTLELPKELKGIHSTFHVSNLKKCLSEGEVVVPLEEIQLDDKLHMIEEPVEIVDKEVKRLNQVLLRVPRKDNIYSVDLKSVVPTKGLTCLFAKAIIDESNLWHRRLGHTNFKNMNKLVRGNLVRVIAGNQTNGIAEKRDNIVAGQAQKNIEPEQEYILIPLCTTDPFISQSPKDNEENAEEKPTEMDENGALDKDREDDQVTRNEFERNAFTILPVSNVTPMNDTGIFGNAYDDQDVGAEADLNNLETTMNVNPIPTTRIDKDHPKDRIIGDLNSAIETRRMTKIFDEHAMVEAMQEELLQFQLQKVWTLVDLPNGKRPIRTKWVFRNKKDERGIVVRNKARLVAQVYTQEEGIDYDEVFAPIARVEAIRLFFSYASFMGFIVYQMDVKSAFLYGTIEEEVYVCQPPGFEDSHFPDKVYKEKCFLWSTLSYRAWYRDLVTT
ncbi:putative ribonuclease H-like domain-containing protein [Tanacetum coccineum]